MKARGWLSVGIVLMVVVGLVSCTKEQIDQAMIVPTKILTYPSSSDSGKPNSPQPASPTANGPADRKVGTPAAPVREAATSHSGSASVGSVGASLDVTGLRIGMTPDQTRAILKAQVLVSDSFRKSYKETRQTLMITLPGGVSGGPVQNGTFLSHIQANGKQDDLPSVVFYIGFSPVPGQEGIVAISRSTMFPDSKKTTLDAFKKALSDKYGPHTLENPDKFGFMWYWSYDHNGALRSPGSLKDHHPCTNAEGSISYNGQVYIANPPVPRLDESSAQCGDIFLRIGAVFDSPYHGGETMVNGYSIHMTGLDAAIRAARVAGALIDKASAEASAAAIKKGQQQKPEF